MKQNSLAYSFVALLVLVGTAFPAAEDHTHPHPGPVAAEHRSHVVSQDILDKLDVGFLVELEGFAAKAGDVSESDITLATVELTVDADMVDGVAAHLGLLWEEDGTEENILDEGYITFGATETIPFYATAGKMYLPFGNFESAFISDPLTLEMAEINESAALAGFGNEWVDVNAGGFNGSNDNTIENGFAALSFTLSETVVFGAYWISNILETDGFDDDSFVPVSAMNDVGGAGAFVNAQIGIVSLNAEYVTALEKIEGTGLTPNSYNIEVSMPIGETLSAGMKFEGSDDFFAAVGGDRFANWQTGFVVSCEFNEHVILSGEYLHADGLDNDESGDTATMQIALVF